MRDRRKHYQRKENEVKNNQKLSKKVMCIVTAALIVWCCIFGSVNGSNSVKTAEAAGTYNGNVAASYGYIYTDSTGGDSTDSYNKNYPAYYGHDCANFVSQCLVAGGLQTDGTWYVGSRAWVRADYLLEWFRGKAEYRNLIVRNPSPSDVRKGDPLFYVWGTEVAGKDPNDVDHAGICTAVNDYGTPLVSAHTNNTRNSASWRMGAGAVYVVKLHEISNSNSATGVMTTPTISTDRECYAVGETINITWQKTSSQSDFLHYWLIIYNTDTGKECFGGATGSNGDVNANSYRFTIPEPGHYRIDIYAVPYNDKEHRQKEAVKTVCTYEYDHVDLGAEFDANIINTGINKLLTADNNDNVVIRSSSGTSDQLWHFIRQGNGSYEIVNKASGKALDDCNWGQTNGTNVGVYTRNNTTAQKWFVRGNAGSYFLNASCGSAVLDVESNHSADGTNVWLYERNDTDAQKFTIRKTSGALGKCDMTGMSRIRGGFKVSWNTVSGATKYGILRKKAGDNKFILIATVSGGDINTYRDISCVSGNIYIYKVRAVNQTNTGTYGMGYYGLYLDSPDISLTKTTSNSVTISWNIVDGIEGYYVYLYDDANKTMTEIKDVVGRKATSCIVTGLQPETTYKFVVKAYGACIYNNRASIHTSYKSNVLEATTPAYNGLVKRNGAYYYYKNGVIQKGYTGLVRHTDGTWCYVKKGRWQSNYKGMVRHINGKCYYVNKGRRTYSNGLVKHTDGNWWYVKKGEWQSKYKGIVRQPSGNRYYVEKGKKSNKTGYVTVNSKRYRIVKGRVI